MALFPAFAEESSAKVDVSSEGDHSFMQHPFDTDFNVTLFSVVII